MFLSMFMPHIIGVCVCECLFVGVFVFVCINAGLSGNRIKKLTMPGQVRYRTKPRQSGIFLVRYRTVIIDAGMPMPSYAENKLLNF